MGSLDMSQNQKGISSCFSSQNSSQTFSIELACSYMNKAKGATIGSSFKALGFKGCWQGLGPRIIMIGTLTALQWFIYDGVKVALALPRYEL